MMFILITCSLLLLMNFAFVISHDDSNFFEDNPPEMRCNGCLMTVKALNKMLLGYSGEYLEAQISKSITNVCEEKRLSISEYNPKVVMRVCKYLTTKYRQELFNEMVRHYSQLSHSTYLQLAHHICQAVLRICPGPSPQSHDTDEAWLHIDEKTQEFKVMPGKNLKIPRPVPDKSHNEL